MATINSYLIPLTNIPELFTINLAGTTYTLTSKWNDQMGSWILDLADSEGNMLAAGLPFVTGADLLDGLEYLGVDGTLIVFTNGDQYAVPTLDNLGSDSNLYFNSTAANNGG
jgi:hypothetical protein